LPANDVPFEAAQMATSVDSLDRRIETVTAMTNSLFAENARREAVRLEKNQDFLSTAARYSNAFSFWAYAKRKSWGHLLLRRIITCLEKVQSAEDGSEALLDQIAANLAADPIEIGIPIDGPDASGHDRGPAISMQLCRPEKYCWPDP
jgi:hypothetical protein